MRGRICATVSIANRRVIQRVPDVWAGSCIGSAAPSFSGMSLSDAVRVSDRVGGYPVDSR